MRVQIDEVVVGMAEKVVGSAGHSTYYPIEIANSLHGFYAIDPFLLQLVDAQHA